jgi:hypothetical protein
LPAKNTKRRENKTLFFFFFFRGFSRPFAGKNGF